MKGKNVFTEDEDLRLESLIEQKQGKSKSEQTKIRNRIRSIGFYYSDFSNKKEGYTVEDYRKLKRDGVITIVENQRIIREAIVKVNSPAQANIPNAKVDFKEGLAPLVGEDPRVLVLGTLPGDESIKRQVYYSNPGNQFWKILDGIASRKKGQSNEEFAKEIGIALWDCCHSAVRKGSSDDGFEKSTEVPNDLEQFLKKYPSIEVVVLNGTGKTTDCYNRFFNNIDAPRVLSLISTSSARGVKLEDKIRDWSIIKKWLKKA